MAGYKEEKCFSYNLSGSSFSRASIKSLAHMGAYTGRFTEPVGSLDSTGGYGSFYADRGDALSAVSCCRWCSRYGGWKLFFCVRYLSGILEKCSFICRRTAFVLSVVCVYASKGVQEYEDPIFALCRSGWTGGDCVGIKGERQQGSLTVEAACVMSIVLFAIGIVIYEAGRMHDETAGAMILCEAVEKSRHEKWLREDAAAAFFADSQRLWLNFPVYGIDIVKKGRKLNGNAWGGRWNREIQMEGFRPELFMRRITLLEDKYEGDNS